MSAKILRYAQRVIKQHDANGDGRLDASEWRTMRGEPARADLNGDGQITPDEFAQYVANYSAVRSFRLSGGGVPLAQQADPQTAGEEPTADQATRPDAALLAARGSRKFTANLPPGVPPWFVERDADGDGQLTLAEFSPKLLKNEVEDFDRYDLNRDGVLTALECLRAGRSTSAAETSAGPATRPNP